MTRENVAGSRRLNPFLRMAVVAGVESAVQIHIERGDDLDARDTHGMTPLMLAAARNKPEICRLLLNAGADHRLLDPSGRTALDIATSCGSETTAAIFHTLRTPVPSLTPANTRSAPSSNHDIAPEKSGVPPESAGPSDRTAPDPPQSPPVVADSIDDAEFDLSGWEAEEEPTPPKADLKVLDAASSVQTLITSHKPIDSSADWDDVDADLPESVLPLARPDDVEGRARLRHILLRSIREGSIPSLDVRELATNEDSSINAEAEAYLTMVINDLGAEVDERIEFADANASFEVYVYPQESSDEEAALDEAMRMIDCAVAPRNEPLRIYQREFQRLRLLTAEEEVQLAKDMEAGLEAALDALAEWPDGIARTLVACAEAIAGSRQLSTVWTGGAELDQEHVPAENLDMEVLVADGAEGALAGDGEPGVEAESEVGVDANFAGALQRLAALVENDNPPRPPTHEVRQALAALHLNRRFLLSLVDPTCDAASCPAFVRAMAGFRIARDRMTAANLKLAFFHAKKYLHSGEPLDDLAQEGNLGLLKAVDRYDWRRGFRFSTYATWWIRQQISRHIADKARTVRMPVHVFEKAQRAEREAQAFEMAFGREPTINELARRVEMPTQKLAALLRIAPEPLRIDDLAIDGLIAIEAREAFSPRDPADVVDEMQLRVAVDRYISSLSTKDHKEERVLRLRFGIGIGEALTLEEVGQRYGVTRERIRQIEAKAIRKLKHPVRSEPFARLALGLKPEDNPLAAGAHESEGLDAADVVETSRSQDELGRAAEPQLLDESIQAPHPSVPTELDRALAQAAALGVHVDDDRLNSGRICVELLEDRGRSHRLLAHRLIVLGFNFLPGKGFWK